MAIPEPLLTLPSHQETLVSLKEAVEVLAGERKQSMVGKKAVTWDDLIALGLIQPEQVPRE